MYLFTKCGLALIRFPVSEIAFYTRTDGHAYRPMTDALAMIVALLCSRAKQYSHMCKRIIYMKQLYKYRTCSTRINMWQVRDSNEFMVSFCLLCLSGPCHNGIRHFKNCMRSYVVHFHSIMVLGIRVALGGQYIL